MILDDVPADVIHELTDDLDRLFRFAKCIPTCHACLVKILIGDSFQLLSLDGKDEMVCHLCDRDGLRKRHEITAEEKEKAKIAKAEAWSEHIKLYGYSRPSKAP